MNRRWNGILLWGTLVLALGQFANPWIIRWFDAHSGSSVTVTSHVWLTVVIPMILAGAIIFAGILNFKASKSSTVIPGSGQVVAFYPDRKALNSATGGLPSELDNLREGLAMWPAGASAIACGTKTLGHIKRLIMLDPNDKACIAEFSRFFFPSEGNAISTIREVTRLAQEAGVEVKWSCHLYVGLMINDPNGSSAYARFEMLLPGIQPVSRPSIFIKKADNPETFTKALKVFDCMWNEAKEPS